MAARRSTLPAVDAPPRPPGDPAMTPLDYLLAILRDEAAEPGARFDAAKAAAPYVHQRHASVEHSGDSGGEVTDRRLAMAVLRLLGSGLDEAGSAAGEGEGG
jgi:hypothetical protein